MWEKVMVTGHRPQHLGVEAVGWLGVELPRVIEKLRERGMRIGISGMALGVDQWWAHDVLAAGLELWSFVPFPQQGDRWTRDQRAVWEDLRSRATKEMVIAREYSVGALHQRNDTMLSFADAVVSVWDPQLRSGGTFSCMSKALDRRMPVIHLDPVRRTTMLKEPLR